MAETIWLLDLEFAGRTYRWASRAIDVTKADATTLRYEPGLDVGWEDERGLLNASPAARSMSFELVFKDNVAQWVARGHDLSEMTGELSRHTVGQTYERRRILLSGRARSPVYDEDGPVSFTLEQTIADDRGLTIDSSARIMSATWGSAPTDSAVGAWYPTVWGQPGFFVDASGNSYTVPATPGFISNLSLNKLLIAGHRVAATSVTVFDVDGDDGNGSSDTFAVTHQEDSLGRTIARVDLDATGTTPSPTVVAAEENHTYWVAWHSAGALQSPRSTSALTGMGDLLLYLLRRSTIRVDFGRLFAALPELNAYQTAGYIDEPVSVLAWVEDNIMPLVPAELVHGPEGVYPRMLRVAVTPADATHSFEVGRNCEPVGPIEYDDDEPVNELTLEYGLNPRDDEYALSATIQGAPHDGTLPAGVAYTGYARASYARYGRRRAEPQTTDIVYDRATAWKIVNWQARLRGFRHRRVTITIDRRVDPEEIEIVKYTHAGNFLADQVADVISSARESDRTELTLRLRTDPPVNDIDL